MKVLLIDDDPLELQLLAAQLATLCCRDVVACESGADACRRLERDAAAADVVVCDLRMPGLDGVEVLRRLAQLGYRGKVVLMSGEERRVLDAAARLAREHGLQLSGVLAKPASGQHLCALLAACAAPLPLAAPPGLAGRAYSADEVRRAIDAGELVNHYQPQVDLSTGAVVAVESLVRWRHPVDGLVYPDRFVPVAEHGGLIDALTRAVLADALRQLRRWHDGGLAIDVAVNVSMDNLKALDFPDFVAALLAHAGVARRHLVLEVTESRLMQDRCCALDVLTRLRLKSIALSIDDFGTGHSSLAQLRDIPFTELKIDRAFVRGAGSDPALRAICEGSLSMARQLGMRSVAEGVEDLDDWRYVQSAGCSAAQGYFIARPMPAEHFASWLEGWRTRVAGLRPLPASAPLALQADGATVAA